MIFLRLALLTYKSYKSESGTLLCLAISRVLHFLLFCFINSRKLDYKYWPSGIYWQILKSLLTCGFLTISSQRISNLFPSFHATDFRQSIPAVTITQHFLSLFPVLQIKYRGYANVMINHKTQGLDRNMNTYILRRLWTWKRPSPCNFARYSFGDRFCVFVFFS